jgi:hypothetical protein
VSSTAKQQLSRNPQNAGYANPIKTYPVPAVENSDGTISVPAQPVYGIDPNHEPIDMYLATRGIPGGIVYAAQGNATTVTISTLFNCPAGFGFELHGLSADITASATVGNRNYFCQIVDTLGSIDWRGALSANVAAAQICGYDVGFGNVGAPSTTVRTRLGALTSTNIQVREMCPHKALENRALSIAGGANAAGPIIVAIVDAAGIDGADTIQWRLTGRYYPL